jgi:hypothetical protein
MASQISEERLEEIREQHKPTGMAGYPQPICFNCYTVRLEFQPWPCDAALALAEIDRLRDVIEDAAVLVREAMGAEWVMDPLHRALASLTPSPSSPEEREDG